MVPVRYRALLIGLIFVIDTGTGFPLQEAHFDLGGPCSLAMNSGDPGIYKEIAEARKSQSWDRLIELEKRGVRGGCTIEYRWRELANVFVEAGRQTDAIRVLEEMDTRGFDLSFGLNHSPFDEQHTPIDDRHRDLEQFMQMPAFRATSIGTKIERLKNISTSGAPGIARYLGGCHPTSDRLNITSPRELAHLNAADSAPGRRCRIRNWSRRRATSEWSGEWQNGTAWTLLPARSICVPHRSLCL